MRQSPETSTRLFRALTIIITGFVLSACVSEKDLQKRSVVALVNGERIPLSELYEITQDMAISSDGSYRDDTLIHEVLNRLIMRKLLLQEARSRKLTVSDAEAIGIVRQVREDYTDQEFAQYLEERETEQSQWEQDVLENLLIQKLITSILPEQITVSDREIESYYQNHLNTFQKPEEVRVRQIVLSSEQEAILLRQELLSKENFAEIARERSISPDRAQGGDLGYFSKGRLPPEFDIVFTLQVDSISQPVKSPYGYHLFQVLDRPEPRLLSLEEAKESIYYILAGQKKEQVLTEWMKDFRFRSEVYINHALLKSAFTSAQPGSHE